MATKTLNGSCLCGKVTYALDLPASEPNPKVLPPHLPTVQPTPSSPFILTPCYLVYYRSPSATASPAKNTPVRPFPV
ncbi:hypothetical protein BDV06DRAFT_182400, partial [Aspergillus oleicola]